MSYTLTIQSDLQYLQNNHDLLTEKFDTKEEFEAVANLFSDNYNQRRIYWLESLIIPIRTDKLKNFCKDFFLPGFFNTALKTHELSVKIFLMVITPFYDLLTLPIRCITIIPRYLHNVRHSKESHPFYQYLIEKGVNPKDLDRGCVQIKIEAVKHSLFGRYEKTFNFMQLPNSISTIRTEGMLKSLPEKEERALSKLTDEHRIEFIEDLPYHQ